MPRNTGLSTVAYITSFCFSNIHSFTLVNGLSTEGEHSLNHILDHSWNQQGEADDLEMTGGHRNIPLGFEGVGYLVHSAGILLTVDHAHQSHSHFRRRNRILRFQTYRSRSLNFDQRSHRHTLHRLSRNFHLHFDRQMKGEHRMLGGSFRTAQGGRRLS